MRREYQFDYRKSRPNRFAPLMKGGTIAIVLDPDVASVGLLTAGILTPTLAQLQQYDVVVVVSAGQFGNPTTLGDNLADYVDQGGVVVEGAYGYYGPGSVLGLSGRWLTGNYSPYNYSKFSSCT